MSLPAELLLVSVLIVLNGVFVMSEMAIVSARKVRLQQLANHGDRRAEVALDLAMSPDRFLPTVQVGITLMAILSGARGESAISRLLAPQLEQLLPRQYSEPIAAIIAIATITYLTIVIAELVPKQIALNSPEKIASFVARPIDLLARLSTPLIFMLSRSTNFVVKLFGIRRTERPEVTEEEIKVMIEQGTETGMFEESEQDMVEGVLSLGDLKIGALMTPRPDITWIDINDRVGITRQKIIDSDYSRLPVCEGELDRVLGVVHVADLLSQTLQGEEINLTASLSQPLFIPESTRGLKVLEQFKKFGTHIAMVVDEYGVIQGLVTMHDLFEEIFGDITDFNEEPEEPQIIQREDGSWLLDGMLSIEELLEQFDIPESAIDRGNYHTLGGFAIMQLGKIPISGEYFEWRQLRFEIVDMDGKRVDKILVKSSEPIDEILDQVDRN
ncbi:hemolysin family protein [Chamaesiphon sp. OTE_75_metabat_556]|jgi:putative hemolysin|uniref:hemolysin family protein n=1 Tax=Chamaesiphon sp. OTE_75_metabat_556 TaxID=2964692 RepID=UPI00286A045F|nr:hemolysin family protein [Chamaesiphon sp. OTE_75_metabat_556]